jgi:hypothetical protein
VWPQIAVIVLTLAGLAYATWRVFAGGHGDELPNLVVNAAWGLNNVVAMLPLVRAASGGRKKTPPPRPRGRKRRPQRLRRAMESNLVRARGSLVWLLALASAFGAVWWIEKESGRELVAGHVAPREPASAPALLAAAPTCRPNPRRASFRPRSASGRRWPGTTSPTTSTGRPGSRIRSTAFPRPRCGTPPPGCRPCWPRRSWS